MGRLGLGLVIEPILVLNLVRARSSWLGFGTEPLADQLLNRRRIVRMRRSTHTWPIKLCSEAWGGRSLTDRQTGAAAGPAAVTHAIALSPNDDVDRNNITIVS